MLGFTEEELIKGCLRMDRRCQKEVYKKYYSKGLSICLRYGNNPEDAAEILNDGFLKVFTKIHTKKKEVPFQKWIMRIMVNTAIDFYRANLKELFMEDIDNIQKSSEMETVLERMGFNDLLKYVQNLSLAYRTVFNLYVIEGFSHEEISSQLSISIGTSKSNLFKARARLKTMIEKSSN
jgi:RNA polymerase sigma factor (sigma-70 family)